MKEEPSAPPAPEVSETAEPQPELARQEILARLVDAGVDSKVRGLDNASDHAPAWIVL